MTARLTLICHAPTAATRAARFPSGLSGLSRVGGSGDEAADAVAPDRAAALAVPAARHRLAGPERRCRDTAAALGLGSEGLEGFESFAVDDGLRDQDFGRWAGRTLADVAAAEPDAAAAWMTDPAAAPHGGESVAALVGRVAAWMAARAALGGRSVAVTHPAVVRAAVAAALGAGPASFWRIEAPPLARAVLSHDGRRWTLAALLPPP